MKAAFMALLLILPSTGGQAMRLGGHDRPMAVKAVFDGVGRIECPTTGGRATIINGTGWIIASADTVVTAAHTLFGHGEAVDPKRCVFRLLGPDGSTREVARVRYIRSPWSDARHHGDSAYDVAILKLDRRMQVRVIAPVEAARRRGRLAIELISLPGDVADRPARISTGEARPFPLGAVQDKWSGMHVSDPSLLFASSADSAPGSSGGIYFAQGSGAAIGLHVGYVCGGPEGCFNFGLRFDARLLTTIAAVAVDDGPAEGIQLASAGLLRGLR